MYRPTTSVILDTRKALSTKQGKFSVKLRVTFKVADKFVQEYYPLKMYLGKKEYEQIRKSPKDAIQKEIQTSIEAVERKAWKVCGLRGVVDKKSFEAIYFGTSVDYTVDSFFERTAKALEVEGRIGTATGIRNAIKSFIKYDKPGLLWMDITSQWLIGYETHSLQNGLSVSTIGIHLRALRKVFNEAIANGEVDADLYPFRKYQIKTERKIKLPVGDNEVDKLKGYSSDHKYRMKAVSFWLMSYYCNGMNFNDIAYLKWTDIVQGNIIYDRNKTRRTKKVVRKIVIPIRKEVQQIIDTYGNPKGTYIFPFIEGVTDAKKRKTKLKQLMKTLNRHLRDAAKDLKIDAHLMNSIARHTYANKLLNMGVGKEFIQYALGHTSMDTTENYLSGFEMDRIKKVSEML